MKIILDTTDEVDEMMMDEEFNSIEFNGVSVDKQIELTEQQVLKIYHYLRSAMLLNLNVGLYIESENNIVNISKNEVHDD